MLELLQVCLIIFTMKTVGSQNIPVKSFLQFHNKKLQVLNYFKKQVKKRPFLHFGALIICYLVFEFLNDKKTPKDISNCLEVPFVLSELTL